MVHNCRFDKIAVLPKFTFSQIWPSAKLAFCQNLRLANASCQNWCLAKNYVSAKLALLQINIPKLAVYQNWCFGKHFVLPNCVSCQNLGLKKFKP